MNDFHKAFREALGVKFDEDEVRFVISGETAEGKTEWIETTNPLMLEAAKEAAVNMQLTNVKVERLTRGEIWKRFGEPEGSVYEDENHEHQALVLDVPFGIGVNVIK